MGREHSWRMPAPLREDGRGTKDHRRKLAGDHQELARAHAFFGRSRAPTEERRGGLTVAQRVATWFVGFGAGFGLTGFGACPATSFSGLGIARLAPPSFMW